jgi:outer membrane biogenesis lipoprotein LolB
MKRTFLLIITISAALILSACSLRAGTPESRIAADISAKLDRLVR